MKLPLSRFAALTLAAFMAAPVSALSLYDPALGLPSAQGWVTGFFPSSGNDSLIPGPLLRIDTEAGGSIIQHGHGRSTLPTTLDTVAGFTLNFSLNVVSETHDAGNDRAGFSLLVQGLNQAKSIQLSFWSGMVWASDTTFQPLESMAHPTSVQQPYALYVVNDMFTLKSGATTLLSGAMRDYPVTPGNPLTNVYGASNVLWFGDNTTSAKAIVDVGAITLSPIPEPASALMLLAGLAGLGAFAARRRA